MYVILSGKYPYMNLLKVIWIHQSIGGGVTSISYKNNDGFSLE